MESSKMKAVTRTASEREAAPKSKKARSKKSSSSGSSSTAHHNHKSDFERKSRQKAVTGFLEGLALYLFCVTLPTVLGIVVKFCENRYPYEESDHPYGYDDENNAGSSLSSPTPGSSGDSTVRIALHRLSGFLLSSLPVWSSGHRHQHDQGNDASPAHNDDHGDGAGSAQLLALLRSDQMAVVLMSIFLAALRLTIVRLLVPKDGGENDNEVLQRCRSTHFLRPASYNFQDDDDDEETTMISIMTDATHNNNTNNNKSNKSNKSNNNTTKNSPTKPSSPTRRSSLSAIHKEMKVTTKDLLLDPRYATAVFRLLYTSAASLSAFLLFKDADFWPLYLGGKLGSSTKNCWDLSGGIAFTVMDDDFDHFNQSLRYYFLVQVSYQLQSLTFHFILLLHTCLSYNNNNNNNNLKQEEATPPGRLPSSTTTTRSTPNKSTLSWTVFLKPIGEHIVALVLISGSFLFSSWRRLTTVAMFALDLSGLFLHLLQLCLNWDNSNSNSNTTAHNKSDDDDKRNNNNSLAYAVMKDQEDERRRRLKRKQKRRVVWFVHRFLVLPTFMYCRLFILPFVIWYSAAFESNDWLHQMEFAFVPGWGDTVYFFFNGLFLVSVALNLVYFRRLLFHPHVRQTLKS